MEATGHGTPSHPPGRLQRIHQRQNGTLHHFPVERSTYPSCQGILSPRPSTAGHNAASPSTSPLPSRHRPALQVPGCPVPPGNAARHAVPLCVVSELGGGSSTPRPKLPPFHHANARKPGTWTRKPAKTRQQPPSCPPPATAILPASSPCPLIARCWPFKAQHSISFIPAPKPAEWGSCESHMTHSAFCNVAIKKEFPAAAIALQPCRQPAPPLVRFASVGNATLQ